jgi:hypothetical protein
MADEIGVFTPEQARLIWQDYQTRQQLAPHISQNFPRRRIIDEPSPHRVFVRNESDEEIPAYGCMEVTGTEEIGGRTVVTVTKPTRTDGEYLFNSQFAIAAAAGSSSSGNESIGNGWAFRFGVVIMLGSPPSEPGAAYGPIVDSWEIEETDGPFVVFGPHNAKENALIGRIGGGGGSGDYIAFEFVDESAASESASSGTMGACQYFPEGGGPKICEMMTAAECEAVGGAFNLGGITTCDSGSSSEEGLPEDCDSRVPATGPFFGRVVKKSCGMDTVPGEDADGLIELQDDLGILDNRDMRDIVGRIGFAVRMKEEPSGSVSASVESECYWMIVIVNFWRVVQVVTDVVFGAESITIKRKSITVWDDCSLPDEIIEGTDCPLPGSGSSSSGSLV